MAAPSRSEVVPSSTSSTSSSEDSLASASWGRSWLGRLLLRSVVAACGVLEVVVMIPTVLAEQQLMSHSIGPWPLALRLGVSAVRLAPFLGALAKCFLLPRLWRYCVPRHLHWRIRSCGELVQAPEVRWGMAITLDMWYLLSTPLNVGLREAWYGILLVANIFLCFVDTVTLLAALSTKPRSPVPEGRSLRRARHIKMSPEEGAPQTCAICLSDFEEDEAAVQLPCSHVFHCDCITVWLQRSRHCPMRCPELVLPPRRLPHPDAHSAQESFQPAATLFGADSARVDLEGPEEPEEPEEGPEGPEGPFGSVAVVPSLPGQVGSEG